MEDFKIIVAYGGEKILVSSEDYDYLTNFRFNVHKTGYVFGSRPGEREYIHRLIARRMRLDMTFQIDHKDNNKLNNLRNNLRIATPQQNIANHPLRRNNATGYKGVFFDKRSGKYIARVRVNYKKIHLGYYYTAEGAHKAYVIAANKYFGEYAREK